MKNIFRIIAAFAAISLAFASCAREELAPETPQGPTHTVKFTTGIPETKTEMSIDGNKVSFTWSDDDLDRLVIKENGVGGTIDTKMSTISANELVVYATFPGEASEEQKTYTAVLGGTVGDQTPRVDSYDKDADILIAKPEVATAAEAIKFQFGRPVAINKMTLCDLPAGETLTSVKVSSDKDIAGTVGEDGWDGTANELVLTVGRKIPSNGEVVLYYTSVPAEGAMLTVEATVGTDSYKKVFGKGLTTTAGNVKGYSVGLKKMETKNYTLEFNSKASGVTGISKTTKASTFIVEGTDYVEESPVGEDVSKCFYGGDPTNGLPLRVGASGDPGTITLKLSDLGKCKATKIVICAKQYSPGKTKKIGVFNADKQKPGDDYTNLTFNLDGSEISSITLNSDGYIFVKSISVESYGEAPSAINASDIEDVAAAGVTDATFNFTAVNVTGTPTVFCDGIVVTAVSVEGRTVTYTVSENTTYKARQGTITITIGTDEKVVNVNQNGIVPSYTGAGTLESPYTVADALLKIETLADDEASEEVYVAGPIKSITTASENFKNGQITYVLGTDETNIQIYCGKDFDGKAFSSVEDIAAGQNVVVKGQLTLFQSTKEMKINSQLVKVNGYDYVLKSIEVTGAKTVFDEGQEFSKGDAVVTASYRGNKVNTNVTASAVFTGYESTVGQHDITVSYSENGFTKTTQYQVTVASSTKYGISVNQTGTGSGTVTYTVNGESGITESKAGATVVVTVSPAAKNHVEAFSVTGLTGTQALEDGEYEFKMPESAVTINVQFEPNPTAPNGTTLWSEDFSGFSANDIPAQSNNKTTVFGGGTVTYSCTNGGSTTKVYNENTGGGTAPELLVSKVNGSFTISGIPTGNATAFTFTLISNKSELSVTVNGATVTKATGALEWAITLSGEADTFNMVITNNSSKDNARIDNLELVVGAPKLAQTISFDEPSKVITLGDTYTIGETYYDIQTASLTVGNGAISYSVTDGTDVIEVNSAGHVKIKKAGTATITATAAETDTYKSATASYTLTINEAGSSTLTYSFTIQTSDFNTTSYDANNGSHNFTAKCTTDQTKTMEVAVTTNAVYQNASKMQWQKTNGYIYNTTDLGTINSVEVKGADGSFSTYYGTTEHPTSGETVGNGFFTVKNTKSGASYCTSIVVTFTK